MAVRPAVVLSVSSSFWSAEGSNRQGEANAALHDGRGTRQRTLPLALSKAITSLSASLSVATITKSSTTMGDLPKPCFSPNGPASQLHACSPSCVNAASLMRPLSSHIA
jgi:hypothetical protein